MKKQLAVLILSMVPFAAMAADNFTGPSIGVDIETAKYKAKDSDIKGKGKGMGSVVLRGEHGFDMGNNLVGTVEATAKLNSSKAFKYNDEQGSGHIKQKDRYTLGYQQGYRVTDDLMPYAKVEYINSKFKGDDVNLKRANGVGVGLGAKYAITDNVEMGAEYTYSHLRAKERNTGEKDKLNGNAVSAGVSYRFK